MLKQRARSVADKEHRKLIILESARQLYLFDTDSIPTMSEIAIDSRMTKGNIYNYFKKKETIYLEILILEYKNWFYKFGEIQINTINDLLPMLNTLVKNKLLINLHIKLEVFLRPNLERNELESFNNFINSHIIILSDLLSKNIRIPAEKIQQSLYLTLITLCGMSFSFAKNNEKLDSPEDVIERIWTDQLTSNRYTLR